MAKKDGWIEMEGEFYRRDYDYEAYLKKQGEKIERRFEFAKRYSDGMVGAIYKRATLLKEYFTGCHTVLCLGARCGGEVEGFIKAGYFAVGIDVNPGPGNRYVMHGDFHDLQFADQSVDMVYTNSLDHAYDMRKLLGEVYRVLKPCGIFYTENKVGVEEPEGKSAGSDGYDCMEWKELARLGKYIEGRGFTMIHEVKVGGFTPWAKIFRKEEICAEEVG